MSLNTSSVFYQIGQGVTSAITTRFTAFASSANTYTGLQTYTGGMTVSATLDATNADITAKSLKLPNAVDNGVAFIGSNKLVSTEAGFTYDASTDTLSCANLNVTGTTTSIATTNTTVTDALMVLNKGGGSSLVSSGIIIERTASAHPAMIWRQDRTQWEVGTTSGDGSSTAQIESFGKIAANNFVIVSNDNANHQTLGHLSDFTAGLNA